MTIDVTCTGKPSKGNDMTDSLGVRLLYADDSLANISSKINTWKRLITWFGGKGMRYI